MLIFPTLYKESFVTRVARYAFNFFPAYRRGGGRVLFISANWQEIHVKIALNWATRNYVGSVFGGSLYAAIDPIYMLQLIKILGDKYIVWDKAATIEFVRPVKSVVYARFELNNEIIQKVKEQVLQHGKYFLELPVLLCDANENTYVKASKVLYIADKEYYKNKPKK